MKRSSCWNDSSCDGCMQRSQPSQPSTRDNFSGSSILSARPSASSSRRFEPQQTGQTAPSGSEGESPEYLIANDIKLLTINEREDVYEEIHGVKQQREETDDFIDECLEKLQRALKRISKDHKAYSRAVFLNKAYVKSRDFEIMFLRSDDYDANKVAKRIVLHFEKKLGLFGNEKLTRDIRWTDLDLDGINSLRSGVSSLFPSVKDTTGRAIHFIPYNPKLKDPKALSLSQAGWYKLMTAVVDDQVTQKRGCVGVFYTHEATMQNLVDTFRFHIHNVWMGEAMPFRLSASHICMPTEILRSLFMSTMNLSSTEVRLRTKLHYGSLLECMYELNSFGIAIDKMPMNMDGSLRYDFINTQLTEMKRNDLRKNALENARHQDGKIVEVREVDVLLGKGPPYQWYPGNVAMMDIIKELKPRHEALNRTGKKSVASEVLNRIKKSGGRFLERDSGGETGIWVEATEQQAHAKVAMGFRNLTKRAREQDAEKQSLDS